MMALKMTRKFLADEEKKVLRLHTTIGELTDEFFEKE